MATPLPMERHSWFFFQSGKFLRRGFPLYIIGTDFRSFPVFSIVLSFTLPTPVRHVFQMLKLVVRYLLRNLFLFASLILTSLLKVWFRVPVLLLNVA